jgi:membrane associated rhomboid family serine protease
MMEPDGTDEVSGQPGHEPFRPELRAVEWAAEEPVDSIDSDACLFALARRLVEKGEQHAFLAPHIPPPVLTTALQGYLDLEDDEILLAMVGTPSRGATRLGCSLTSIRIYWPATRRQDTGGGPPRSQSLAYGMLPEGIARAGGGAINLGGGRWFGTSGSSGLRAALIEFLGAARAMSRGEGETQPIADLDLQYARSVWPHLVHATAEARALQSEIRQFEGRMMHASRAIVTPVIALACVVVYLVMLAKGVPWLNPKPEQLLASGADFGPSVIIDHEYWRLFTSMFIHAGLVHMLMNVLCLAVAGPLLERLLGHVGFAALYVLSGLGGSIVSVWSQPLMTGVGASGAVFGVFGGLLGFLAIRHREVPFSILKPMRASAIGFVAFNLILSAVVPGISMAAHVGGLVTGFLCGLLMTAVAPADARVSSGVVTPALRAGVAGLVGAGILVLGYTGLGSGKARILADPAWAINDFLTTAQPIFAEFKRVEEETSRLASNVDATRSKEITESLVRLKSTSDAISARIRALPAANPEVEAMRDELALARDSQRKLLDSFDQYIATGDKKHIDGPGGLYEARKAYDKHLDRVNSLVEAYIKAHGFQMLKNDQGAKP